MENNNTKPENPAAFPRRVENNWGNTETSGMSLRDYFAAKAMQGLISRDLRSAGESNSKYNDHHNHAQIWNVADDYKYIVRYSYKIADAMLLEREKQQ